MPASGVMANLQLDVASRLQSNAYFNDIVVLTEAKKDITYEINRAVDSIGVCVVVLSPIADVQHPNEPGPVLSEIHISISVLENVIVNQGTTGTGKAAIDICENILSLIHQYNPIVGGFNLINCSSPALTLIPDISELTYECHFITADCQ